MQLSTRTIVIAGVLIAVALVLAFTGLGYFPVPNVTDSATIMHVPSIVGGVLEGPVVGLIIGIVFAIDAYIRFGGLFAGAPAYLPFLILLAPRLFIGIVAALVYRALKSTNEILALIIAAAAGTLTNTVLVLGLAVLFWSQIPFFASIPGLTPAIFVTSAIPQAIFEMILAIIVTVAVVAAWKRLETRRGSSV
ncbi:MAG: ECF transporter S component [Anaerolineales bacterium]|nr:ECF transporter S component [Anaerolineales bacterium]